ncbi:MAG: acyltransferase [Bacteroidetes bacterium]|nr:MAG: acyltransferase [Bacteroidota bacterium]
MAIMPVLIQHLSERLLRYSPVDWTTSPEQSKLVFMASRGTIGVFLFFAISGFILALPFAKSHLQAGPRVSLKAYFWRRLTRLEPPYIFWMTLFALVLWWQGTYAGSTLWGHWAASIGYMHNLVYEDYSIINPVAWSLEIEVQFYLVAPLLAAVFFRWSSPWVRRGLLLAAIVAVLVAQKVFGWVALPYKLTLLWQLQYFLIGFLVADFFLTDWHGPAKAAGSRTLDILAGLAFLAMCFTWSADLDKRLLFALALLIFLVAAFRGRYFTAFLRRPWIAIIGGMCYTIYLVHLPLLEGLSRFTTQLSFTNEYGWNLLLQALILFPIVFLVSALGFLLIEKPCMNKNWPQDLWRRLRTIGPSQAAEVSNTADV